MQTHEGVLTCILRILFLFQVGGVLLISRTSTSLPLTDDSEYVAIFLKFYFNQPYPLFGIFFY